MTPETMLEWAYAAAQIGLMIFVAILLLVVLMMIGRLAWEVMRNDNT